MDDTIRMAREAGLVREWMDLFKKDEEALARFADLVRADEREACARVCDDLAKEDHLSNYFAVAALALRERNQK